MKFPKFNPDNCDREGCTYFHETPDAYNTGDSPTSCECTCSNVQHCPLAEEDCEACEE